MTGYRGEISAAALTAAGLIAGVCGQTGSAAAEPKTLNITVATFNICNTKCGSGKFAWSRRKPAILRNIVSSDADVVAIQEADKSSSYWLIEQLSDRGYEWAAPDTSTCDNGCVPDSHVFYKRATMQMAGFTIRNTPVPDKCQLFVDDPYPEPPISEPVLPPLPEYPDPSDPEYQRKLAELERVRAEREALEEEYWRQVDAWYSETDECGRYYGWTPHISVDAGSLAYSSLVAGNTARGAQSRNLAWAALRHKSSGSVLFAVSVHLPNEKTPAAEKLRRALASSIPRTLAGKRDELGVSRAPTLVMGDLNSFEQRQHHGAHWILTKQGYRDAYSAKRRTNGNVSTINVTTKLRNPFPAKPFRTPVPTRIDYVFLDQGRALEYAVHLRLRNGRFDNRYRSSDHNLVRARLRLPSVSG